MRPEPFHPGTEVNEDARVIIPPAGRQLPEYDRGWVTDGGGREPFLSYVDFDPQVNWSEELEELHEEASRTHFIDRWTRSAVLSRIGVSGRSPVVIDVGCSTGYMLEDLRAAFPEAQLVGVDLVAAGLRKAHPNVPDARLLHADACALPIEDASADAVVTVNLLEHVPDDVKALAEIHRILRPGGRMVAVVPAGSGTYDYYDRFLGHERRYGRRELAGKAAGVGLRPLEDTYIGSLLYPAFWAVKQRNRRRFDHLRGEELAARVAADIGQTRNSRAGELAWRLEDSLNSLNVRLPFGIRSLVVAVRPGGSA